MKIDKLSDLFEINFKKIRQKELVDFFRLCLKYHTMLFDPDFFKLNFSSVERFLRFIHRFKNHIYFVLLNNEEKFAGFLYLYETRPALKGFFDTKVTFCICRPYWGFGSYVMAKRAIRFLFEEMKVRKLTVESVGNKSCARRLIQKLGFELEAVLKEECFRGEKTEDLYLVTKFNPAFEL